MKVRKNFQNVYFRVNWDFIKASKCQVSNAAQQEPGQTLIEAIYLEFILVHKYVLNVYCLPDTRPMMAVKSQQARSLMRETGK